MLLSPPTAIAWSEVLEGSVIMARQGLERVLVVGGGVGGMSTAIQFSERGLHVDLVEIDPKWRATGAGLTLNGATLRVFERLGVLKEIAEAGDVHGGRKIFDRWGKQIFELPARTFDANDILASGGGILRPDLHRVLATRARSAGVNVRLGMTISHLTQGDDCVDVRFSDESEARYDLVVGADGITSLVRRLIIPAAEGPKFTGQGCWRAVFQRPDEVHTTRIYVDRGYKLGLNPVSRDQMYMFLLETAEGNPWREEAEWVPMLRERMLAFGDLPHRLAYELSEDSLVNYRPIEVLLLPLPWHVGRVVLIGDAVHATTPHAGYGAGLSIEDGVVLGECLSDTANVEKSLQEYESQRYGRCRMVLEGSLALGRLEMAGASIEEQTAASVALIKGTLAPF